MAKYRQNKKGKDLAQMVFLKKWNTMIPKKVLYDIFKICMLVDDPFLYSYGIFIKINQYEPDSQYWLVKSLGSRGVWDYLSSDPATKDQHE